MRRSKFDQAVDILSCAIEPILMTNLLTKTNLDWTATKFLFKFLEVRGFLKKFVPINPDHRKNVRVKFVYQTTQKGIEALEIWKSPPLNELLDCYEWVREQKEAEG